jgi:hypothetical protein
MMTDSLESLLVGYKHWRDIGNDALIVGLIVEVAVIVLISEDRKYKWLFEVLAAIVVLARWIEVQYGGYADEIERQIRQQSHAFEKEYGKRELTNEQQRMLITRWHKYAYKPVKLGRLDDPETIAFANQLLTILTKAGLKVEQTAIPAGERIGPGVFVEGSWADMPILYDFANPLNCLDINANMFPICGATACDLRIEVGYKPLVKEWRDMAKVDCRSPRPSGLVIHATP